MGKLTNFAIVTTAVAAVTGGVAYFFGPRAAAYTAAALAVSYGYAHANLYDAATAMAIKHANEMLDKHLSSFGETVSEARDVVDDIEEHAAAAA